MMTRRVATNFFVEAQGFKIVYCAESFVNDCSTVSSILKTLSRTNASEFSKELSVRVSVAKSISASRGYWVGGPAPYGYRRMIISSDSTRNRILKLGENKALKSDRIILVPGPQQEIETVKTIFGLVKQHRLSYGPLAKWLNSNNSTNRGSAWIADTIKKILHNQVYIGTNVWGRRSAKLGQKITNVPTEKWVIRKASFRPLITEKLFFEVQRILKDIHEKSHWSKEKILSVLKKLLRQKGKLSYKLLTGRKSVPNPTTVIHYFGSLTKAYDIAGYWVSEIQKTSLRHAQETYWIKDRVRTEILRLFPSEIFSDRHSASMVMLRDGTKMLIAVPNLYRTKRGNWRWFFCHRNRKHYDEVLLCLRKHEGDGLTFYRVAEDHWQSRALHMKHPWLLRGTKLSNLSELFHTMDSEKNS